jgi:hypothetical protein
VLHAADRAPRDYTAAAACCCCCLLLLSLLPDDCSVPPDSMDGVAALGELTGLTQLVMLTALKVCWGARDYF